MSFKAITIGYVVDDVYSKHPYGYLIKLAKASRILSRGVEKRTALNLTSPINV